MPKRLLVSRCLPLFVASLVTLAPTLAAPTEGIPRRRQPRSPLVGPPPERLKEAYEQTLKDDTPRGFEALGAVQDAAEQKLGLALEEATSQRDRMAESQLAMQLVMAAMRRGDGERAYAYAIRARKATELLDPPNPVLYGLMTSLVASSMELRGKFLEAEPLYLEALEPLEEALGKDNPMLAGVVLGLGNLYETLGRYSEAEPLILRTEELFRGTPRIQNPASALVLGLRASLADHRGDEVEALEHVQQGVSLAEKHLRSHPMESAQAMGIFAMILMEAGKIREAERLLQRSLTTLELSAGRDHLFLVPLLDRLSLLAAEAGEMEEAIELGARSMEITKQKIPAGHPMFGASLLMASRVELIGKRYEKSGALAARALEIIEKGIGPDTKEVAEAHGLLARVARARGDLGVAKEHALLAAMINAKLFPESHRRRMEIAALLESLGNAGAGADR